MQKRTLLETLKTRLLELKTQHKGPWVAAFDADGTLWDTDMGELFFEYQIKKCGLNLPTDPWSHYHELKKVDHRKAYLWLAQINKGRSLQQVRAWAEEAYLADNPQPVFQFQKSLISFLLQNGFSVYIVTASVKWAVEPAARRLGLTEDNVLGVKTAIKDDLISLEQDGPITWREGKVEALLAATKGVRPLFCAGNTTGDTALLESSCGLSVAVLSQKPGERLHSTEMELQEQAKTKGWLTLDLSHEYP